MSFSKMYASLVKNLQLELAKDCTSQKYIVNTVV